MVIMGVPIVHKTGTYRELAISAPPSPARMPRFWRIPMRFPCTAKSILMKASHSTRLNTRIGVLTPEYAVRNGRSGRLPVSDAETDGVWRTLECS